jgi:hypothetical protein
MFILFSLERNMVLRGLFFGGEGVGGRAVFACCQPGFDTDSCSHFTGRMGNYLQTLAVGPDAFGLRFVVSEVKIETWAPHPSFEYL